MNESIPVRDYRDANKELLAAYDRYLESRGGTLETRRSYARPLTKLLEAIGSQSIVEVERIQVRELFMEWEAKGLHPNSIRLYTAAFRAFYRFLNLSGVTRQNPMWLVAYRKVPARLPVVLTVADVEKLIAAAQDPFERAAAEVLYGTGVRVSELIKLRLEDIVWGDPSSLRVHDGKGGKDRVVLLGTFAADAIRDYQQWRPSKHGYVFEAPPRIGVIKLHPSANPDKGGHWRARFYLKRVQREFALGSLEDVPTKRDARAVLDRLLQDNPGYRPKPARPYNASAIRDLLDRLGRRAGIPHVHPHALRRAMATHMLQSGANLRVVQDLLGHERLTTTMRYLMLTADDMRRAYEKAHPHAKGEKDDDGKKE